MDKKPKVLLAFTEAGMGHITSLQAIKDSLVEKYAGEFDFIDSYPLEDGGSAKKFEKFMINEVISANVHRGLGKFFFALLELLGRQLFLRFFHRIICKKATDSVVESYRKENPDIIVSTNHYTTFCALEYRDRFAPDVFVVTYNPDNNTHVWWDNRAPLFIVNCDGAYDEAVKRGFKPRQLKRVGYTVRKKLIDCKLTKSECREKYGLPADKFTVLLADGAYAMAKSKDFAFELLRTDMPITILYIAGKNKQMFDLFVGIKKKLADSGKTNVTFEVYPFMPDIHELYRAADIFVTKGGPNSIFDCVYMGTPVVVNYCSQPMEQQSYNLWVKKEKCGVGCFSKRKIRPLVEKCIISPEFLREYENNVRRFSEMPSGSDDAADIIYNEYIAHAEVLNGTSK